MHLLHDFGKPINDLKNNNNTIWAKRSRLDHACQHHFPMCEAVNTQINHSMGRGTKCEWVLPYFSVKPHFANRNVVMKMFVCPEGHMWFMDTGTHITGLALIT